MAVGRSTISFLRHLRSWTLSAHDTVVTLDCGWGLMLDARRRTDHCGGKLSSVSPNRHKGVHAEPRRFGTEPRHEPATINTQQAPDSRQTAPGGERSRALTPHISQGPFRLVSVFQHYHMATYEIRGILTDVQDEIFKLVCHMVPHKSSGRSGSAFRWSMQQGRPITAWWKSF